MLCLRRHLLQGEHAQIDLLSTPNDPKNRTSKMKVNGLRLVSCVSEYETRREHHHQMDLKN